MILVTKTSDQARQRGVCVCVFINLHITAHSGPVIYSYYTINTACNSPRGLLFVDIFLARNAYVCLYVFIKLHITAQSGPVILCHSH